MALLSFGGWTGEAKTNLNMAAFNITSTGDITTATFTANSTVTINGATTFNTDVDFTLSGTENITISHSDAVGVSPNPILRIYRPTTAGTHSFTGIYIYTEAGDFTGTGAHIGLNYDLIHTGASGAVSCYRGYASTSGSGDITGSYQRTVSGVGHTGEMAAFNASVYPLATTTACYGLYLEHETWATVTGSSALHIARSAWNYILYSPYVQLTNTSMYFGGGVTYGSGEYTYYETVQTTDATATSIKLLNQILTNGTYKFGADLIARGTAGAIHANFNFEGLFKLEAGAGITQVGASTVITQNTDDAALSADWSIPANVNITSYEDNLDGKTKVNAAGINTNYANTYTVRITGSAVADYNGDQIIEQIAANSYVIDIPFNGDGGASVTRPLFMKVNVTGKAATTIDWNGKISKRLVS